MNIRKPLLLGTFALFVCAVGAARPGDDTYSLKETLKKGDTLVTTSAIDMQGPDGGPMNVTMKTTRKINDVKDDGSYTFTQSISDIVVGGQPMGADTTMHFTMSPANLLVDAKVDEDNSPFVPYRSSALDTFAWPAAPVKIGDKWSQAYKAVDGKWNKTTIDYTLAATEKVNAFDCVRIDFEAKESNCTDPGVVKGSLWLDAKTFGFVKKTVHETDFPIGQYQITGTVTQYIEGAGPSK